MSDRLLPAPVGLNAEFYAFLAHGELRLQRCAACGAFRHPPRHRCATCGSLDATWELASGRGRLFSWTVTHRPLDPAFEPPYVVAVVETDEGPRLVANLRDVQPWQLTLDLPLVAEIEVATGAVGLLWFRPAPE
jgi:uncharacterized OB-fold protein